VTCKKKDQKKEIRPTGDGRRRSIRKPYRDGKIPSKWWVVIRYRRGEKLKKVCNVGRTISKKNFLDSIIAPRHHRKELEPEKPMDGGNRNSAVHEEGNKMYYCCE